MSKIKLTLFVIKMNSSDFEQRTKRIIMSRTELINDPNKMNSSSFD